MKNTGFGQIGKKLIWGFFIICKCELGAEKKSPVEKFNSISICTEILIYKTEIFYLYFVTAHIIADSLFVAMRAFLCHCHRMCCM